MLVVLGMHRSGTSVVTGMLADQRIDLGPASEEGLANPRGTRELPALNRLHERILRRGGWRWWRPPEPGVEVEVERADRAERDAILAELREPCAVKDPRMLLVPALWRELEARRIGVIRNPEAVARSLDRRRRARGGEGFPRRRALRLWGDYNRRLLADLEAAPFPVVDFDRRDSLGDQVRVALAAHGFDAREPFRFFEPELVSEPEDGWRAGAGDESLELWERLRGFVVEPARE